MEAEGTRSKAESKSSNSNCDQLRHGMFEMMKKCRAGRGGFPDCSIGMEVMREARKVLGIMGKDESLITYVTDRPGHDYRYALDTRKIERELGWKPSVDVDEGLRKTIQWFRENEWWWRPLKEKLSSESKGFWEKK